MKLKIQQNKEPENLRKGEGIIVSSNDGTYSLMFGCPKCGKLTTTSTHRFDKVKLTASPSLVHNETFGGCGWHGHLKNGIFENT